MWTGVEDCQSTGGGNQTQITAGKISHRNQVGALHLKVETKGRIHFFLSFRFKLEMGWDPHAKQLSFKGMAPYKKINKI